MNRNEIKEILLANGFAIKPGRNDLKEYVYQAAKALIAAEREACARIVEANAEVCFHGSTMRRVLETNAELIRARGQQ